MFWLVSLSLKLYQGNRLFKVDIFITAKQFITSVYQYFTVKIVIMRFNDSRL